MRILPMLQTDGIPIVPPSGASNDTLTMDQTTPIHLAPAEKLDALRYLDEFHFWHSLDHELCCSRCGRSFNGRQIEVLELRGTRGRLRLQCPSMACASTPGDWSYVDPTVAAKRGGVYPVVRDRTNGLLLRKSSSYSIHVETVGRIKRKFDRKLTGHGERASLAAPTSICALIARFSVLRRLATGLPSG